MKKILLSFALFLAVTTTAFSQGTLSAQFFYANAVRHINSPYSDFGVFNMSFNLTATGGDVFISTSSSLSPILGPGFNWSSGLGENSYNSVSIGRSLGGGFDPTFQFFQINEGQTANFDFSVAIEPKTAGIYIFSISLDSLGWTTSTSPNSPVSYLALQDFQTPFLFLQAVPEPSTLALAALGVGSLFFFRRKLP